MKKINLRPVIFALALALLLSFTAVPTLAAEDEKPSAYEWELNDGMNVLSNNDRSYRLYELPVGYFVDFEGVGEYYFANDVLIDDYYECSVVSYARDGDIAVVYFYELNEDDKIYVTEAGSESIMRLISGSPSYIRMFYEGESAEVSPEFIDMLKGDAQNASAGISVDAAKLKNASCCALRAYDSTYTVWREDGMIFEYSDSVYYLDYKTLSNSNFDSYGNLSFRSGSFTLYPLSSATMEKFASYEEELDYWYSDYEYESDELSFDWLFPSEEKQVLKFWIIFAIIGYALPVSLVIVGVLLARSKRRGRPKHWYIISALGAGWILLSVIITALLA